MPNLDQVCPHQDIWCLIWARFGHTNSNNGRSGPGLVSLGQMMVDLFFSVQNADNCIRVGNDKGLIRNILQKHNSDVYVLYEPFKRASDFFKYPLPSSHLGIFKVSELSGSLRCAALTEVSCKYIRLPYKESHILIPLLHQFV